MSVPGLDIRLFLNDLQREGQLDSQGGFTLSVSQARKKLAAFSLPDEYDWVLKLVQAVNLWKAKRLVVCQTWLATSFTIDMSPCPGHTDILTALAQVSLDPTDPVHAFCMALRSLVHQVGLSFVVAFGHEPGMPLHAGANKEQIEADSLTFWGEYSGSGMRLTVGHLRDEESVVGRYLPAITRVPLRQLEIMQRLQQSCFTSQVEILLEGRRLNDPTQIGQGGYSKGFRVLRLAALGRSRLQSKPAWRFCHDFPRQIPSRRLQSDGPPDSSEPWYLLRTLDWTHLYDVVDSQPDKRRLDPKLRPPKHQVFLVRQGVVCESYQILNSTWASSLILAVPIDHLRSDLTGLRVDLQRPLRKAINSIWARVADDLEDFPVSVPPPCEPIPSPFDVSASDVATSFSTTVKAWFLKTLLGPPSAAEITLTAELDEDWQRFVLQDLRRVRSDLYNPTVSRRPHSTP